MDHHRAPDFVSLHGGAELDIREGGPLITRLAGVARAAEQIADELRSRLAPDEVGLEFGLKVSGAMNLWFFAKAQSEGTVNVTLKWHAAKKPADSEPQRNPGGP